MTCFSVQSTQETKREDFAHLGHQLCGFVFRLHR